MEDLGKDQRDQITAGYCPTCSERGFVLGPAGGAALNIECANLKCRARFNVTNFAGQTMIAQQIERECDGGSVWPGKRAAIEPTQEDYVKRIIALLRRMVVRFKQ